LVLEKQTEKELWSAGYNK